MATQSSPFTIASQRRALTGSASSFPCSNCSIYNMPHLLTYQGGASPSGLCEYLSADTITCLFSDGKQHTQPVWRLDIDATGNWVLVGGGVISYGNHNLQAVPNPLVPVLFDFIFTGANQGCVTWPPTITIAHRMIQDMDRKRPEQAQLGRVGSRYEMGDRCNDD